MSPRIVAGYAREMGGRPDRTVSGHDFRTSPPMAAFVNGVSGHVLD
jgi:2-methylcitrate dehydratase PrpD